MSARILVVDDIEANVRLLEAKLSAEYYDVSVAYDGMTALAMAADARPDIILLDVMMPGLDGFETCRRLKADTATRHIPVVLVTALDGRQDRLTGLKAGADDFLNKPIDDVALYARVRSLTRLKLVIDELRQRDQPLAGLQGVIALCVQQIVEELHVELVVFHDEDLLGGHKHPCPRLRRQDEPPHYVCGL